MSQLFEIHPQTPQLRLLRRAAEIIRGGGVIVYPTETNFLLCRVPDANAWWQSLRAAGILVKNLHGYHPLTAQCLRITVGAPAENDALLGALQRCS